MRNRKTVFATCSAILCACMLLLDTFLSAGEIEDPPVCGPRAAEFIDPVPVTASAGTGLNYSTGFEPEDGFNTLGYISHVDGLFPAGCSGPANPCWGHTTSMFCGSGSSCPGTVFTPSTITPSIDTVNPAAGLQHLRLTHDPSTRTNTPNFGLGVDVRYPRAAHLSVRPVAPTTSSADIAIDSLNGQNFRFQPQSNSQGCIQGSALFYNDGSIYILDDVCGTVGLGFLPTGFQWDSTGAYQNFTWEMNPCTDTMNYFYGGQLIYSGCVVFGTNLEQLLVFGDNFPGSSMDVDNVVLSSDDQCPCICGDGIIQSQCETCEPGVGYCNPGHTCGAIGTADECQCSRTCTLAEPCVLENGMNGPFYGPFDAAYGGIFTYNAPAGVDAVSVELCGSTGTDQRIFYWGSCTDLSDPGSANDDCCDPASPACGAAYGAGSDPSASCYNNVGAPNYEPCTCHDNPMLGDNCYLLQIRPPSGNGQVFIEVNKKSACAAGHLGACCDTNGPDQGCIDNTLSSECVGVDKVWTENGKCADINCMCIPDCTAATCGDDGCGGSCGTCDDGNPCNGVETCNASRTCDPGTSLVCNDNNACNGVETCDPGAGCRPGTPLNCNDGVACNGIETCNPSSGCVGGTPVNCDDGIECTVDACNDPDGSCTNDDSDCAIPTVSQWGLAALALILLIGAKMKFGLRGEQAGGISR